MEDINIKQVNEEGSPIAEKKTSMLEQIQPIADFQQEFEASCKDKSARIGTGIHSMDLILNGGLANELYIIGAETSTGKSAFMMHLAERAAESGIDVLYFALEMGRKELVARSIASISHQAYLLNPKARQVTASDILQWTYDNTLGDFTKLSYDLYSDYADEYFRRYGEHLYIIEAGVNGTTVNDIANTAALHKEQTGHQTVVIVDYLQIIRADKKDRTQTDRKTKTDITVATLKSLASQFGMPVITASSIGRSSYKGRISSSAYKESGDVEYTGGILLGWNWLGVTDQSNEELREKEIKECKKRGYRKMSLDVLKNRNAERDTSVKLRYYPAYNYFTEETDNTPRKPRIQR